MRRRPLLILLLLALAAAALLLLRTHDERQPPPEERERAEAPEAAVDPVAPPRLQGDPAPAAPPSNAPDERERTLADDALGAPGDERVVLAGTIEVMGGPPGATFAPPLPLQVGPLAQPTDSFIVFPVKAKVDRAGPFAIDVTKVLREQAARNRTEDLRLDVDHPDYMPIEVQIPIPDPEAVLTGRATLERIALTLQPAGIVEGVLLGTSDGDASDPHWLVLLYSFGSDGLDRTPLSRTYTDETGGFRLRFPRNGRYLVAAPGAAAGVAVDLVRDRPGAPVELRAPLTYDVRGVVRHGGKPVASAVVRWNLLAEGAPLTAGQDSIWDDPHVWTGEAVHQARGAVSAGTDGRFVVPRLAGLPHRFRVEVAPGIHPHTRTEESLVRTVTPPTPEVVFDLALARLEVQVEANGPLEGDHLDVMLTDVGMAPELGEHADDVAWRNSHLEVDENGRATCLLSPQCRYVVTVEDDARFEPFWHQLTTPDAGETVRVVATMTPLRPKPGLVVTLEGEGASDISQAGFGFYPPEKGSRAQTPFFFGGAVTRAEDGAFNLENLVPGPWRLHVRPGRGWFGRSGAWVEATCEVEVPASGEARVSVRVEKGGRLHLHVTDADGRQVRAECKVTDEHGAEVPAWFIAADDDDNTFASTTSLPEIGPCWVEPVLSPGPYRVALEADGYRKVVRNVTLEPGLPTTVRVVLEREE